MEKRWAESDPKFWVQKYSKWEKGTCINFDEKSKFVKIIKVSNFNLKLKDGNEIPSYFDLVFIKIMI